jgi:hypothetical protein
VIPAARIRCPGIVASLPKETGINDITVTCGCGRKMTQRGTDPKGALRCGCGVRDPELLSHIQMIRDHYGEPKMTGYLPLDPG